ncbi:flagellar motor protein MotB [Actibacterium pelagium]|uniref:Flagellar motor protein MotB n=2 Tax=Actibacterium pelagium TaxID=2029103 RepID=A0A917AD44_9RHOB|nr:flagellar motor protein MotB [Actibacterium pelagium]
MAQDNPFAPGWDLDPAGSYIRFISTKNVDGKEVVETHSFATFSSVIEPTGDVKIVVKLESVDTNNDLRNVRMRFLFFETFKFPEAIVTTKLTPEMASGVQSSGSSLMTMPFNFEIHGEARQVSTDITVTAEGNDRIVVNSARPFRFRVAEFGLQNNLTKIAQTAGGFQIVPEMDVIFQLAFNRRAGGFGTQVVTAAPAQPAQPVQPVALETQGEFSYEECTGRFEILSETGNIYFSSGSARLQPDSRFVLSEITDIIKRCPRLRVLISGHTDSDGTPNYNQRLSEQRAQSVVQYLIREGIDPLRLYSAGFGEDRPMVPNDSPFNKGRNRRIEFSQFR